MNKLSREQWLNECVSLLLDEIFEPVTTIRADLKIRVSVGYPAGVKSSSAHIAICHPSKDSHDGSNEIFITPAIDDSMIILANLCHEICHAILDCEGGHGAEFRELALSIGLIGPMTSTVAGDDLNKTLKSYVLMLGQIPHSALDHSQLKRDVNRNLKVWCVATKECGFKFNTSKTQIENCIEERGEIMCPKCGRSMRHNA